MKLLFIMCCFIVMFKCTFADEQNGIKNFFEKLHDTSEKIKSDLHKFSEKVKSDIQKILPPKVNKNNSGNTADVKSDNKEASTSTTTAAPNNTKTPSTVRTVENVDNKWMFPTDDQEGFVMPERPTTTSTQAPVTGKNDSGIGKDGKENFKGGCLPGHFYTSDGRCMPEY